MLDKELILIGYAGHAYVLAETVLENGFKIAGYADKEAVLEDPFNLSYLGFEKSDDFIGWQNQFSFVIGIGENKIRQNIAELIESKGSLCLNFNFITN